MPGKAQIKAPNSTARSPRRTKVHQGATGIMGTCFLPHPVPTDARRSGCSRFAPIGPGDALRAAPPAGVQSDVTRLADGGYQPGSEVAVLIKSIGLSPGVDRCSDLAGMVSGNKPSLCTLERD